MPRKSNPFLTPKFERDKVFEKYKSKISGLKTTNDLKSFFFTNLRALIKVQKRRVGEVKMSTSDPVTGQQIPVKMADFLRARRGQLSVIKTAIVLHQVTLKRLNQISEAEQQSVLGGQLRNMLETESKSLKLQSAGVEKIIRDIPARLN